MARRVTLEFRGKRNPTFLFSAFIPRYETWQNCYFNMKTSNSKNYTMFFRRFKTGNSIFAIYSNTYKLVTHLPLTSDHSTFTMKRFGRFIKNYFKRAPCLLSNSKLSQTFLLYSYPNKYMPNNRMVLGRNHLCLGRHGRKLSFLIGKNGFSSTLI